MSRVAIDKPGTEVRRPAQEGTAIGRFVTRYGWSYVFIAPSMIVFSLFTFFPALASLVIAFQDVQLRGQTTWVGFANFVEAFTTQGGVFVQALQNTFLYTVVTVTANVIIALVIAALIRPLGNHMQTFFRGAYYLPAVS